MSPPSVMLVTEGGGAGMHLSELGWRPWRWQDGHQRQWEWPSKPTPLPRPGQGLGRARSHRAWCRLGLQSTY